jgi:protein-disulfide isomerase
MAPSLKGKGKMSRAHGLVMAVALGMEVISCVHRTESATASSTAGSIGRAPAEGKAGSGSRTESPNPVQAAPVPAPPPASSAPAAAAPAPAAAAATTTSISNSQPMSDELAGKSADLSLIANSPKQGSPYLGPADALVVVNVFSDFQCPVCKRSADPIKQLVIDFPGKVKVFFRNNALAMHGRSSPAAIAAGAARVQGKFWQYHDRLFANQAALDDASLKRTAESLGLDVAQWEKDLTNPEIVSRVTEETRWAPQLGAVGTPSFFINGIRRVGWGSYLSLRSTVEHELAAAEALVASGTPRARVPSERTIANAKQNPTKDGDPAIDPELWAQLLTSE